MTVHACVYCACVFMCLCAGALEKGQIVLKKTAQPAKSNTINRNDENWINTTRICNFISYRKM